MTIVRKQKRHFKIELAVISISRLLYLGLFGFFCSTGEVSYNCINRTILKKRWQRMEDARVVIMIVYLVACYCFAYYGVQRNDFFCCTWSPFIFASSTNDIVVL